MAFVPPVPPLMLKYSTNRNDVSGFTDSTKHAAIASTKSRDQYTDNKAKRRAAKAIPVYTYEDLPKMTNTPEALRKVKSAKESYQRQKIQNKLSFKPLKGVNQRLNDSSTCRSSTEMPAVPGLPMASPIRRPTGTDLPPVLAAYSLKRHRKPVGLSEKALANLEETIIGTHQAKNALKRQAVIKDPRIKEWLSGTARSTRASAARRYLPTVTSLADMPMPDHVSKGHELATDCLCRMHALLQKKGITPVDLFRGNMIVPRQQQVTPLAPFPSVPALIAHLSPLFATFR